MLGIGLWKLSSAQVQERSPIQRTGLTEYSMEYRETCDIETRDLGEKPMLGIGLWKPILRTGEGKETIRRIGLTE